MTPEGNFEGHTILNRLQALIARATRTDEARLAGAARRRCWRCARKRVRPGLDDKVLADWNGLMIAALANAGVALGEPHWLEMAARAFMFIARER